MTSTPETSPVVASPSDPTTGDPHITPELEAWAAIRSQFTGWSVSNGSAIVSCDRCFALVAGWREPMEGHLNWHRDHDG